jgi:excisionase family DNA binding protein
MSDDRQDPFGSGTPPHDRPRHRPRRRLYTIDAVAEAAGVSTRTVRRWIEKRLLPVHRVGRVVRIEEDDLEAFLARHRQS